MEEALEEDAADRIELMDAVEWRRALFDAVGGAEAVEEDLVEVVEKSVLEEAEEVFLTGAGSGGPWISGWN